VNTQLNQLDEAGLWIIRGGLAGVLGLATTLREALRLAYDLSMQGCSPGPIVRMPNDDIVVSPEEIYRLWRSLGLVSP
jgi:hypothetical protein